jgi:hypothetical protein
MNNRWFTTAAALLGLFAASGRAQANVVVTGLSSPSPATTLTEGDAPSGTLLAEQNVTYNVSGPGGEVFKGDVTEAVILDSTTGKLDFLYQVHTASDATNGSNSFTTALFGSNVDIGNTPASVAAGYGAGYSTTAPTILANGYDGFQDASAGGIVPSAERTQNGIGFSRPSNNELPIGNYGNILFVRTDATAYNSLGTLGIIDSGATATINAYEPVAVPEPSTVVAALSGLALCGVAAWRRRSRNGS